MAKRLRLGLLGTGVAANELYLPALRALENRIELVACANRRRHKAEAFARRANIPKVVDSADELFALPQVEAVLISLPIAIQPEFVLAALQAGKPVLSEKPVGPSVQESKKLLRAARARRVPWLVGENLAFHRPVRRLAEWLRRGRLGEVRTVQVIQMTLMDGKNPYFGTAWRKQPRHVGGFVVDGGVHVAHAVRRCLGTPQVTASLAGQFSPLLPPLDSAVALLRFDSGALGTWTSCFAVPYQGPMLRVYGTRGSAELDWESVVLRDRSGKLTQYQSTADSFALEFSHFADVVHKGAPSQLTPESALEDLALVEAIVKKGMRAR